MGLKSDTILLQTLTAAAAGTLNSNWFDLSGYVSGAFYLVVTNITGSITPSIHTSPDSGVTDTGALATGELATPGAVNATGGTRYPFLIPMQVPWVRIVSTIVTGPVTAKYYFVGRGN